MRLTTMTTYAVQAMLDLATQPEGRIVTLREIAHRQGIKAKYLEQIFLKLNHAGLIKSKKGPGGGYYLNLPVDSIKIADIMEAVGEKNAPVLCLSQGDRKQCLRIEHCHVRGYWKKLKDVIDTFLDSSTLKDIMQEKDQVQS
jgi:Rrf2 family iron-sulfur cluster assembly transcriptional regulator